MSENLRNYVKSVYGFDHVLRLAPAKAMARRAPCAGWTGRDVVKHVTDGVKMVQSFAATGKAPRSLPKIGDDPMVAWAKLRDTTLTTLDQPGVLQTVAHDPFGPEFGSMPVDSLVGFMAAELAVHTWDLARTAKVDDRMDPALAKMALATWKSLPEETLRSPGMAGPAVKPAKGADVQTRLLNFMGRSV